MHDFDGIVCVFLAFELYETVALVFICYFITGNVDVDYWTALSEELPKDIFVNFLVDVASIDCGLLVAFV